MTLTVELHGDIQDVLLSILARADAALTAVAAVGAGEAGVPRMDKPTVAIDLEW